MRADLVEEDGGAFAEDDMAVVGTGEIGVYKFEAKEFGAGYGLVFYVGFAEFGGVAVGDYCKVTKVLDSYD